MKSFHYTIYFKAGHSNICGTIYADNLNDARRQAQTKFNANLKNGAQRLEVKEVVKTTTGRT